MCVSSPSSDDHSKVHRFLTAVEAMNISKDLIYRSDRWMTEKSNSKVFFSHPLFPLLAIVFDKCEIATNSPASALGSINDDVREFVQQVRLSALQDASEHDFSRLSYLPDNCKVPLATETSTIS